MESFQRLLCQDNPSVTEICFCWGRNRAENGQNLYIGKRYCTRLICTRPISEMQWGIGSLSRIRFVNFSQFSSLRAGFRNCKYFAHTCWAAEKRRKQRMYLSRRCPLHWRESYMLLLENIVTCMRPLMPRVSCHCVVLPDVLTRIRVKDQR